METNNKIRALWLCNMVPSFVAERIGMEKSNKEGWIAGMAQPVMEDDKIQLAFAFPVADGNGVKGQLDNGIKYYGFYEDGAHPENYDEGLEKSLNDICEDYDPQVIHCFGTEYPHILGMLNNEKYKNRTLIHLQGLMEPYAESYHYGVPEYVVKRVTFRDWLRKDSILEQKDKYLKRAECEKKALYKAVNVCGRTHWDKAYINKLNDNAAYYHLNETLRSDFYEGKWDQSKVKSHTIFVSQGNYPLKGAHFLIEAIGLVKKKYSDVSVYISGDNVTKHASIKEKIKLSSYGKYLLELIDKYDLQENIHFVGQKTSLEMKKYFLESEIFVIPSVLENSPNSLGEAMILGMPCVCADVGGIRTMASDDEALFYECNDIKKLSEHIIKLFDDKAYAKALGEKARSKAMLTHSVQGNYEVMLEIYKDIVSKIDKIV